MQRFGDRVKSAETRRLSVNSRLYNVFLPLFEYVRVSRLIIAFHGSIASVYGMRDNAEVFAPIVVLIMVNVIGRIRGIVFSNESMQIELFLAAIVANIRSPIPRRGIFAPLVAASEFFVFIVDDTLIVYVLDNHCRFIL